MNDPLLTLSSFRYINFLAEMVANDKNPSEAQQLALQKEKKVIVHSLRGKDLKTLKASLMYSWLMLSTS